MSVTIGPQLPPGGLSVHSNGDVKCADSHSNLDEKPKSDSTLPAPVQVKRSEKGSSKLRESSEFDVDSTSVNVDSDIEAIFSEALSAIAAEGSNGARLADDASAVSSDGAKLKEPGASARSADSSKTISSCVPAASDAVVSDSAAVSAITSTASSSSSSSAGTVVDTSPVSSLDAKSSKSKKHKKKSKSDKDPKGDDSKFECETSSQDLKSSVSLPATADSSKPSSSADDVKPQSPIFADSNMDSSTVVTATSTSPAVVSSSSVVSMTKGQEVKEVAGDAVVSNSGVSEEEGGGEGEEEFDMDFDDIDDLDRALEKALEKKLEKKKVNVDFGVGFRVK
jgi:hypothetical protein